MEALLLNQLNFSVYSPLMAEVVINAAAELQAKHRFWAANSQAQRNLRVANDDGKLMECTQVSPHSE